MTKDIESVRSFVRRWRNRGYEKGETQTFWLNFLRDVLDIDKPENFIEFEMPVKLQHTNFIDAYFPDTKVIVEQKSIDKDLTSAHEQAQRYKNGLPYSMNPRWIVTCNFAEFYIYDMEELDAPPQKILLEDLTKNFQAFEFLIDKEKNKIRIELELSLQAGEIVGRLYDLLRAQYRDPDSAETLQSLNKLCVRLVFCLYAESAGIFGKRKIFRDYLKGARNIRRDLLDLFDVLNTPIDERDPYLDDELKKFPYVNGGLFADNKIEIPNFTPEIKKLLFDEASDTFNWSGISPTIFGAVFESTLNLETRRFGGMHYTGIENIHKVIDPLFLDDLQAEFDSIKNSARNKKKNLLALQDKLAALKFFDPACGSGNFLTESFISLRRLENDILKELFGSQIQIGELVNPVKVSINQFYGIEINDFACSVAQTALWIAELQMLYETQEIIHSDLNKLPLTSYPNIVEGNALRLDWKDIAPQDLNFIISNPPFVGKTFQSSAQRSDVMALNKNLKALDYVACWYYKASEFIQGTKIRCAFVSTNSITQGEQVAPLWKILKVHIDFAYRTFKWQSESLHMAAVHCVVVGFSAAPNDKPKIIFDGDKKIIATHINGYLLDAPDIFIEKRTKPLCDVPKMAYGNMANDEGNLILSEDEKNILISKNPTAEKFIKILVGGEEFINGKKRYCLWLVDATPNELRKMPSVMERIKKVKAFREKSSREATRKLAEIPHLFGEIRQPKAEYILIPKVSSENRKYVPIGFLEKNFISVSTVLVIPDAGLYEFGVLTSSVHMDWLKSVGGRLESRYQYSASIVYNNFVWCNPTDAQKKLIETTAQKILDVRKKYPDSTLADLYDELTMPKDLRAAHKKNDKAVMAAYGFNDKMTESEIVSAMMSLYKNFLAKIN